MIKLLATFLILITSILFLLNKIYKNFLFNRFKRASFFVSSITVLLIFFILSLFFINKSNVGTYTPPIFDGEKVIPGKVTIEK